MIIEPDEEVVMISVNFGTHKVEYQDATESGVTIVIVPISKPKPAEEGEA